MIMYVSKTKEIRRGWIQTAS